MAECLPGKEKEDRDAYQKRLEGFVQAEHERELKSKCALENYELTNKED